MAEQAKLKKFERVADTSEGRKAARMKIRKWYHRFHVQYCCDNSSYQGIHHSDYVLEGSLLPSLLAFHWQAEKLFTSSSASTLWLSCLTCIMSVKNQ